MSAYAMPVAMALYAGRPGPGPSPRGGRGAWTEDVEQRPGPVRPTVSRPGADGAWTPPTWEEIVREHSARVYRLAYRLTGNRHDAEDLTQEVFVRVFRSLSSYTPGTFEGWLHRITTNLFLDQVRRKQRIRFDALPDDADDRLPGREHGPERAWEHNNLDHDVQAALDDAAAGLPRRGRALRHRGPVLRGDRRHPRHQARHRPLPDPPRPRPAARSAGPPPPRPGGGARGPTGCWPPGS